MNALESPQTTISLHIEDVLPKGLAWHEAEHLLHAHGNNVIEFKKPVEWDRLLLSNFAHPFNVLLFVLAMISAATADFVTMIIMLVMIIVSVSLKFVQEMKSEVAAQALRNLVESKAIVLRGYRAPDHRDPNWEDVKKMDSGDLFEYEIPMEDVVPGDIVQLTVGDMIPGDVRLVESRDLFVSQSTLTGEVMPLEKKVMTENELVKEGFTLDNLFPEAPKGSQLTQSWKDALLNNGKNFFKFFSGCSKADANMESQNEGDQLAVVTTNS